MTGFGLPYDRENNVVTGFGLINKRFQTFMNGFSCAIIVVQSSPAQIMTQTDKSSFVDEMTDIFPVLLFPCHISKGKTKACSPPFVHQETDICFLVQSTRASHRQEAPPQ